MSNIHEYFNRASEGWSIRDFLEECDLEPFEKKTDCYVKSLMNIGKDEKDNRKNKAQQLLDKFRNKASIRFLGLYVRNANFILSFFLMITTGLVRAQATF